MLQLFNSITTRLFGDPRRALFWNLVQVLSQNLNHERRKSDRLLRSVLPATIADELKQTDRVQVDYEHALVLFTDFVGFTQIAESFTPQQLI